MKMIVVDCLLTSIKQKQNIGHNKKRVVKKLRRDTNSDIIFKTSYKISSNHLRSVKFLILNRSWMKPARCEDSHTVSSTVLVLWNISGVLWVSRGVCFFSGVWELVWPFFTSTSSLKNGLSPFSIYPAIYVHMWASRVCFHCVCVCVRVCGVFVCLVHVCISQSACSVSVCVSTHVHLCLGHVFALVPLCCRCISVWAALHLHLFVCMCVCVCVFVFSQCKPVEGKLVVEGKVNEWWCYLFGLADCTFSGEKEKKITRRITNSVPSAAAAAWNRISLCVCVCERERERKWVCVCAHVCYLFMVHVLERLCVCVCVCVCVKQKSSSYMWTLSCGVGLSYHNVWSRVLSQFRMTFMILVTTIFCWDFSY